MITREEYLKALDIVEKYHKQIVSCESIETTLKEIERSELKAGDIAIFEKARSKYVTVGKQYVIRHVPNGMTNRIYWLKPEIIDDKDTNYRIPLTKTVIVRFYRR